MADSGAAHPKAILRGHKSQVHVARFVHNNERLVTGDAEGFLVVWDLTIMRPRAVWRAHQKTILGVEEWGPERLVTHGRDNELIVWKFTAGEEAGYSQALPLDGVPDTRPKPWIQHILPVNAMNFCAFAMAPCRAGISIAEASEVLISTPNAIHLEGLDIYHLPSQARLHTLKPVPGAGMPMALSLFHRDGGLHLIAAYENGAAVVLRANLDAGAWTTLYKNQSHSQPILSFDVSPCLTYFVTSAASAVIAKHPIPREPGEDDAPGKEKQTATAASTEEHEAASTPLKSVNTKHAGQQSLRIRSDGSIFATAGWDSKVRVYSAKSLKEVAVLKWHQSGCFSVAFADVGSRQPSTTPTKSGEETTEPPNSGSSSVVRTQAGAPAYFNVKDRRIQQAREAHWIAAGSKDGKVSLWDIY
ncbi:related to ASTRA-associated protein 1 [Cephalotrichum gorgonifer]|uniref:ASTRA-associated protein 1 n=1 Tax=Cephalotrichum gorgonifer TaxID=2041049 RepID=A0AAE8MVB9_9PEZI|nr:related to ASTRA-associated protein 1 [Cephalotrichum gorgonifer]